MSRHQQSAQQQKLPEATPKPEKPVFLAVGIGLKEGKHQIEEVFLSAKGEVVSRKPLRVVQSGGRVAYGHLIGEVEEAIARWAKEGVLP